MTAYPQLNDIHLQAGKKVYFASDFHFGIPNQTESRLREKRVIAWFNQIQQDASHIFLLGDLFDTWMEYKHAVPKGNVRFLGKLAELRDQGIEIHVFTGNHDLWMYGYFEAEMQIPVYHEPRRVKINNKMFFLGHGDGIGPGDKRYKFLKAILNNKICQYLYAKVHPDWGFALAAYFSKKGADKKYKDLVYLGDDKEYLMQFCKQQLSTDPCDYYVFGHRHIPLDKKINASVTYYNLGDWITHNSYLAFDGLCTTLQYYT